MVETGYVFGTYLSWQNGLDSNSTASRFQAKWRSQIPVRFDLGLQIITGEDEYFRITNLEPGGEDDFFVNIVHLDDLDYELRNTDTIDDFYWIYEAPTPTVGGYAPIGENVIIRDTLIVTQAAPPSADNPNPDPFPPVAATPQPVVLPEIPFTFQRLELGYNYGAVGGPTFDTQIVKVADERETRNSDRVLPLHRYQLGDRTFAESERDLLTEVSYLKQFHADRQGSYQGFRYKDWADYQAPHQLIGIGDGTTTQWQLRKGYWVGDVVTWRPITKPVVGTVVLYANGIEQTPAEVPGASGWTVDHETGVISNPEPLAIGVVLTASYEFDVPVKFESDTIGFSLQGYEEETEDVIYRLESVFVRETPIPLSLPWLFWANQEITEPLDLGIIYDTVEQYSFATARIKLRSGWELAKPNRDESKLVFNLGDRNFDREEVDKLLAYFWNARGQNRKFPLSDKEQKYLAQFEGDRLNLKFAAANNQDALFSLSGIKLKVELQLPCTIYSPFLLQDTLAIFTDQCGAIGFVVDEELNKIRVEGQITEDNRKLYQMTGDPLGYAQQIFLRVSIPEDRGSNDAALFTTRTLRPDSDLGQILQLITYGNGNLYIIFINDNGGNNAYGYSYFYSFERSLFTNSLVEICYLFDKNILIVDGKIASNVNQGAFKPNIRTSYSFYGFTDFVNPTKVNSSVVFSSFTHGATQSDYLAYAESVFSELRKIP